MSMKKIFTLVLAVVAMSFCANAQNTWQEGFEGGSFPEGWVSYDVDGDGFEWTLETCEFTPHMTPHEGNGCMYSESFSNDFGALTPDNWLVTPAISIIGSESILSFWVAGQDANWCAEHYEIYVSTTGNTVADFTGNPVLEGVSTGTYVQKTVNLSSYAGQTIYIAFVHNEVTDQFVFLLDDVEVTGASVDPTSVNEVEANQTSVYPNPANNVINVTSAANMNSIEVYTIAGQKVANYTVNGTQAAINVNNLSNGMYIMQIASENGVSAQKFNVAR